MPIATRRVVQAAHDAGIEVHLWTINDAVEATRWLELGVDGLITDDPVALLDRMHPD